MKLASLRNGRDGRLVVGVDLRPAEPGELARAVRVIGDEESGWVTGVIVQASQQGFDGLGALIGVSGEGPVVHTKPGANIGQAVVVEICRPHRYGWGRRSCSMVPLDGKRPPKLEEIASMRKRCRIGHRLSQWVQMVDRVVSR